MNQICDPVCKDIYGYYFKFSSKQTEDLEIWVNKLRSQLK